MKVILLQDVREQGKKGQVIEVSDGYARNYLIPRKLAREATDAALREQKRIDAAKLKKLEEEKAEAIETSKKLEAIIVRVKAKSGESGRLFGSVTNTEIAAELAAQHGIEIEKNKIITDNIKSYGTYEVKVKLGHEITGTLNVLVTEG